MQVQLFNEALEIASSLNALLGLEYTATPDGEVVRGEAEKPAKKTTRKTSKKAAKKSAAATVLVVAEKPNYTIRELKAIAGEWNRNNPDRKLKGWNSWAKARLLTELQAIGAI